MTPRVLIACERFGVVRDAFLARGHDAWSLDLAPCATGSNRHIRGDVRDHLADGWDLLVVAHPPCTRLCNSGVRWINDPRCKAPDDVTLAERAAWPDMPLPDRAAIMHRLVREGADLFAACWNAPVPRVAVENPIMNPYTKPHLPADLARPTFVQPWWFGDPAFKATGLYLRGLPPLVATNRLTPPKPGSDEHKRWSAVHRASPGPERAMLRSRTFPGIAAAMADQWGTLAMEELAA